MSLADSLYDTDELSWFFNELIKIKERKDIEETVRLAQAVRLGHSAVLSKKGARNFNNWVQRMKWRLEARNEVVKQVTLFDRLEAMRKERTLFERLQE